MRVSVSVAKRQLTELVRRAEAGEEVILTRHDKEVVRLTPVRAVVGRAARRAVLDEVRAACAGRAVAGPSAARSGDFLYDEDGLPR